MLVELIKQAGRDAVEGSYPVAVVFGTVVKVAPLTVLIDGRLQIAEPLLIVPETMRTYRAVNIQGTVNGSFAFSGTITTTEPSNQTYTVSEANLTGLLTISSGVLFLTRRFNVGDELILLRVQGGQRFIALERMREKR